MRRKMKSFAVAAHSTQLVDTAQRMPGRGSVATSSSTAARSDWERRRRRLHGHGPFRLTPRACYLAADQQGARPDARRPETTAVRCILHQQRAFLGTLEEEVRIATRQESRGRHGTRSAPKQRLIRRRIDPSPLGVRTATRDAPSSSKGCCTCPRRNAGPCGERLGALPARRNARSAGRVRGVPRPRRSRRWHHPDLRLPGAVPSHAHAAGEGGVPQPVRRLTESPPRSIMRHAVVSQRACQPVGQCLGHAPGRARVRQPPEREGRRIACIDDVGTVAGSPQLHEGRRFPRCRASCPRRAHGWRATRRAACCPAGLPTPACRSADGSCGKRVERLDGIGRKATTRVGSAAAGSISRP